MLHEFREEITSLKTQSKHFANIFDKHNALDDRITAVDKGKEHLSDIELETLKKEKLKLKDEAYAMIMEYKKREI